MLEPHPRRFRVVAVEDRHPAVVSESGKNTLVPEIRATASTIDHIHAASHVHPHWTVPGGPVSQGAHGTFRAIHETGHTLRAERHETMDHAHQFRARAHLARAWCPFVGKPVSRVS